MPTEIPGINLLVAVNSTAVVAQTDATLTTTPELAEAVVKSTNFTEQVSGDQEWTVSYGGEITTETGRHALANGNASLKVGRLTKITNVDTNNDVFTTAVDRSSSIQANDTIYVIKSTGNDGGYGVDSVNGKDITTTSSISDSTADGFLFEPKQVPGLQTLTLGLDHELNEVPPGVNQATGWKKYVPLRRSWTVEAEGHYYDPDDSDVYDEIHAQRDQGDNLGVILDIFKAQFAGEIAADEMEIEAGTDNSAAYSLSFAGDGEVSKNGSFETTIGSIVDLWLNQTAADVALEHREGGAVVSPSTKWTGTAHIDTIEMEMERNAFPSLSADFQGDGQLSRTVV